MTRPRLPHGLAILQLVVRSIALVCELTALGLLLYLHLRWHQWRGLPYCVLVWVITEDMFEIYNLDRSLLKTPLLGSESIVLLSVLELPLLAVGWLTIQSFSGSIFGPDAPMPWDRVCFAAQAFLLTTGFIRLIYTFAYGADCCCMTHRIDDPTDEEQARMPVAEATTGSGASQEDEPLIQTGDPEGARYGATEAESISSAETISQETRDISASTQLRIVMDWLPIRISLRRREDGQDGGNDGASA